MISDNNDNNQYIKKKQEKDVFTYRTSQNGSQQTLLGNIQEKSKTASFDNAYKKSQTPQTFYNSPHNPIPQAHMMNNQYFQPSRHSSMPSMTPHYQTNFVPNETSNPIVYAPNPLLPPGYNQYKPTIHFNNPFQPLSESNQMYKRPHNNIYLQSKLSKDYAQSRLGVDFSPFMNYNFDLQQSPNSLLFGSNFNFGIPKIARGSTQKTPIENGYLLKPVTPSFENSSVDIIDSLHSENGIFNDKKKKKNQHLKKPIKDRPLCTLCGKTFSRTSSLKTHIFTVHERIKKYQCPYKDCNKRFTTNSNMRRHVRIHERNTKKD
ncbi:uncharacterized protein HGUI_03991 [Hanseniaspora guilliermondii]|uniref:C2H2-type domain-containing protein n=1 Tax=Hanseniaspora guilliermondii TaxID=56406 RepID=A0A1L0FQD4_9ASCO|nr:uncharacterized protein HGUI_03991 [Hanseniaspora guilliermondii]